MKLPQWFWEVHLLVMCMSCRSLPPPVSRLCFRNPSPQKCFLSQTGNEYINKLLRLKLVNQMHTEDVQPSRQLWLVRDVCLSNKQQTSCLIIFLLKHAPDSVKGTLYWLTCKSIRWHQTCKSVASSCGALLSLRRHQSVSLTVRSEWWQHQLSQRGWET